MCVTRPLSPLLSAVGVWAEAGFRPKKGNVDSNGGCSRGLGTSPACNKECNINIYNCSGGCSWILEVGLILVDSDTSDDMAVAGIIGLCQFILDLTSNCSSIC